MSCVSIICNIINIFMLIHYIAGHGPHRVSFYPRGMKKPGHTVCSFVAPKHSNHRTWMISNDVNAAAQKWETFRPSGVQPERI